MSKLQQAAIAQIKKHARNIDRMSNSLHMEMFKLKRAIDEYVHEFTKQLDESENAATYLLIAQHTEKTKRKRKAAAKRASASSQTGKRKKMPNCR